MSETTLAALTPPAEWADYAIRHAIEVERARIEQGESLNDPEPFRALERGSTGMLSLQLKGIREITGKQVECHLRFLKLWPF